MLYQHFANYDYRLHNSFVYNWESDFFAVSGSGYCVEIEVKVSRGDYFRDFNKDKHQLFGACHSKKPFYITSFSTRGDKIGEVEVGKLKGVDDGSGGWYAGRRYCERNGKWGYWVNDNYNAYIQWSREELYAPATAICFHAVAKKKCPNQLYFACPKNLIKLEEIPAYAGLLYCDGSEIATIRRAPYLHKVKQDMTAALLQKFYNLWQYKTTLEQKFEITNQYNLFSR